MSTNFVETMVLLCVGAVTKESLRIDPLRRMYVPVYVPIG